jgi:hypothetical protein
MAQMVVCLFSKREALSLNSSTTTTKKKKELHSGRGVKLASAATVL